jgi:hypothetical protein
VKKMANWIELTGEKTIHNGKEYYATRYSRDVLNNLCGKHCGDPCIYVERKETVHDLNYKNPFSTIKYMRLSVVVSLFFCTFAQYLKKEQLWSTTYS